MEFMIYLSGNRAISEFRDGNGRELFEFRLIHILLILCELDLFPLLATVVQGND